MKNLYAFLFTCSLFGVVQAQEISLDINGNKNLEAINVITANASYNGKSALKVTDSGGNSEAKFLKINGLNFKNGIIEVDLTGDLAPGSKEQARGFVGIAFSINDDNSKFECIYLRPTNGRAEDQVRRNHAVQYISYPDFPWFKLRKESPEKYETYVDLVPGEWTKVKIEIKDKTARLFVHGNDQPTLIVNELLGEPKAGAIGLWIGPGTEAHFSNLVITNKSND